VFSVRPRVLAAGRAPTIRVRFDQPENDLVTARVVVWNLRARRAAAEIKLGRVRTGRVLRVAWPKRVRLRAGRYLVRVHAKDGRGAALARSARASGKAPLTVTAAPKRKQRPKPAPPKKQPAPPPVAPSVPGGGVFPVAGSYTLAGPDGGFGADRGTHSHEGQDIMAAAGLPVVAPVAGVVAFTDYQAAGAGYYVVLNADDGRSMFFAHCQAGSTAVAAGARVSPGSPLCRVGTTGRSTGPHLHFEIWEGGWRDRGGHPVDPLPQLRAWAS
jgi:murein DD-endopeptidase MepM/ murein hydrolase activator NlpD